MKAVETKARATGEWTTCWRLILTAPSKEPGTCNQMQSEAIRSNQKLDGAFEGAGHLQTEAIRSNQNQ